MAVSIALIHYPIRDKNGLLVSTSITNFDIHDIARTATTYSLRKYFIVNPIPSQCWLAERIVAHWKEGYGAEYNYTRKQAMGIVDVVKDLEEVYDRILTDTGKPPIFVATSAKRLPNSLPFSEMKEIISKEEREICIIFGTGWGIHPSVIQDMDYCLEPIKGLGEFNHLSVRSAVAIILDRLLGRVL